MPVLTFPSDFVSDTPFLTRALDDFNREHGSSLRFDELTTHDQSEIAQRAARLKKGNA